MRYWKKKNIPKELRVSIVAAAYTIGERRLTEALMCFVHSIKAQTWNNWELILVHDGPNLDLISELRHIIKSDNRVKLICTEERRAKFGHPWRTFGIGEATGDYIGLSNADNYYAPTYIEDMLNVLVNGKVDFVYCNMIHSHKNWAPFKTLPKKSSIDLGAWICSASIVKSTKWPSYEFNSDGIFIEQLVKKCKKTAKLNQYYLIHN